VLSFYKVEELGFAMLYNKAGIEEDFGHNIVVTK